MDILDKFLNKYSYKFEKGYPDFTNQKDISILESIFENLEIPINLTEVKLTYRDLKKPFPPRHELSGKYQDRGERFLEKIENGEPLELAQGGEVVIDPNNSQKGISHLKNKEYDKLKGKSKQFGDKDNNQYGIFSFSKTKEFGSGSGQGGGAQQTSLQESSQCVVNAIAFNIKNSLIDNEDLTIDNISKAFSHCSVTNSIEEITEFILNKGDWVQTLVDGTNLLFKNYPSSNFEHHRGSEFVDRIYKAFKEGKKENNLSLNNDKWNPSDIWLVDKTIITEEFPTNLKELNGKLINLFSDNLLLGVSLKKLGKNPKLSLNNLKEEDKEGYQYVGYETKTTNNNVTLEYSEGKIIFRTFNYATNFAGEIKGKNALHGKVGHGPINDVLSQNNLPRLMLSKNVVSNIKEKNQEFYQDYFDIYNKLLEPINTEDFNDYMRNKDLNYLVSKYLSLKLTSLIIGQEDPIRNEIISDIIRYASSSTKSSSVFIKIS